MTTQQCDNAARTPEKRTPPRSAPEGVRLKSRLRAFIILIICVFSIYSLALLYQISDPPGPPRTAFSEDPSLTTTTGDSPNAVGDPETTHRRRGWMALGFLLTAVLLAATFLYTRKLLGPLEEIRLSVGHIARGRLDHNIAVEEKDDIGAIAACVNDIAANQQEILLHVWNQTGHSIDLIDRIAAGIVNAFPNDGLSRIKRDLSSVRDSMESLRALAGDVDYYQVNLRDGKVRAAGNPPGHGRRYSQ